MRITLPSGTPAELVKPDSDPAFEPAMGLVVITDIMGLRPLFDDLCARLAGEHRWAVCAVEPFPGRQDMTVEERQSHGVAEISDQRLLGDAVSGADATRCERVGLVGFCMGGMFAMLGAATGRFVRVVSFYGMIRLPENFAGEGGRDPLAAVRSPGAAPVLAILGGSDQFTPPGDITDLEAAGAEVVVYPEAEHGFVHDPNRPTHRAQDAADAWQRAARFLAA